jgi:alkanesulfonate monooxygenase
LLVSLVVRPTHDEAVAAAEATVERLGARPRQTHQAFRQKSDSVAFTSMLGLAEASESPWLTPYLWTGAVPYLGAPAVAIVGSPDEVAGALLAYRAVGVTQFLFMGRPDAEEMEGFARDVLPLVRRHEEPATAEPG